MPLNFCIGLSVMFSCCLIIYSTRYYQMLQQCGYDGKKFYKWLFSRGITPLCVGAGITAAAFISEFFRVKSILFAPIVAAIGFFFLYRISATVTLRITKRMTRLMLAAFTVVGAVCFAMLRAGVSAMCYASLAVFPLILPIINSAMKPTEKIIAKNFLKQAEAKLKRIRPIKIAITGSYGKTTAKNILTAMLKTRFRVCATPLSYNTPAGISVAINDNLSETDEVFIAEMGARRRGDVAFLTRSVMPDIAVITAIGNQHLETFGSVENIIKAKSELLENLPCGGKAFFNGDSAGVYKMYLSYGGNKVLTGKRGDVRYENAVMSVRGMEFDLLFGGSREHITSKLVGKHVPSMICLCASVAIELGVTLNEIKNAVNALQPIAHRLQMLYNGSDVIIDDSFSSNEAGFESAIGVLAQFSYLIKVIITPGVVELGREQYNVNYKLGGLAAGTCDYMIVIGGNSQALKKGAMAAGLQPRCIIEAKSRADAMENYKKIRGGKAVLFENDLPDSYG